MDLFLAKLFTNADDKTNNNMPQVLLRTYFRLSYLLMQMIRQINNMLQVLLMYSDVAGNHGEHPKPTKMTIKI